MCPGRPVRAAAVRSAAERLYHDVRSRACPRRARCGTADYRAPGFEFLTDFVRHIRPDMADNGSSNVLGARLMGVRMVPKCRQEAERYPMQI